MTDEQAEMTQAARTIERFLFPRSTFGGFDPVSDPFNLLVMMEQVMALDEKIMLLMSCDGEQKERPWRAAVTVRMPYPASSPAANMVYMGSGETLNRALMRAVMSFLDEMPERHAWIRDLIRNKPKKQREKWAGMLALEERLI